MKKLLAAALSVLLILGQASALAEIVKDETVYARLGATGTEESVYVVSHIDTPEAGEYIDYGAYERVYAMVREITPATSGDAITWTLPADAAGFYAAGVLTEAALPFQFEIGYALDGAAVDPDALAGQSGRVALTIRATSNANAAEVFRSRYMAQIQVPLPAACANVDAPGATGALVGQTRTLSYTVLPGQDAAFTLAFDAEDFTMDGLTITALPMDIEGMLGMDLGGMIDKAGDMDEGAGQLADGTGKLVEGLTALSDGLTALAAEAAALPAGAEEYKTGLNQALDAVAALPGQVTPLAEGSKTLTEGATAYIDGAQKALSGAEQLLGGVTTLAAQGETLSGGMAQLTTGLESFLAMLPEAQRNALKAQIAALSDGVTAYTQGVSAIAAQAGTLSAGTKLLTENGAALAAGLTAQNDGIQALTAGLTTLAEGTAPLASGMDSLASGMSGVADAVAQVAESTAAIPEQAQALADGQSALLDGIQEALGMLDGLPLTVAEETPLYSFVSPAHGARSVQFVFMTEGIQKPAEEAAPEAKKAPETFWDRLMNLF